jgi:hypothetical protein
MVGGPLNAAKFPIIDRRGNGTSVKVVIVRKSRKVGSTRHVQYAESKVTDHLAVEERMNRKAYWSLAIFLAASIIATSAVVLPPMSAPAEVKALAFKLWVLVEAVVVIAFLLLLVALRAAREGRLFDSLVVSLGAIPAVLTAAIFGFDLVSGGSFPSLSAIRIPAVASTTGFYLAVLAIATLASLGAFATQSAMSSPKPKD